MTATETARLARQLRRDEGTVLHVYEDTRGYLTAGVGHLLPRPTELTVGMPVTEEQVTRWLREDIAIALRACQRLWPAFDTYPAEVQQILANMAFNLGGGGLAGFRVLRAAVTQHHWREAAAAMRASRWYGQVGERSRRLVARMAAVPEIMPTAPETPLA
jgi:lysozyme